MSYTSSEGTPDGYKNTRRLRFIFLFNSRSNSGGPVGGGKDGSGGVGGGGGDGERGEHVRSAEVRFLVQSPFRHIAERAHTHTCQTLRSRFSVYTPFVYRLAVKRVIRLLTIPLVHQYDFRIKKKKKFILNLSISYRYPLIRPLSIAPHPYRIYRVAYGPRARVREKRPEHARFDANNQVSFQRLFIIFRTAHCSRLNASSYVIMARSIVFRFPTIVSRPKTKSI